MAAYSNFQFLPPMSDKFAKNYALALQNLIFCFGQEPDSFPVKIKTTTDPEAIQGLNVILKRKKDAIITFLRHCTPENAARLSVEYNMYAAFRSNELLKVNLFDLLSPLITERFRVQEIRDQIEFIATSLNVDPTEVNVFKAFLSLLYRKFGCRESVDFHVHKNAFVRACKESMECRYIHGAKYACLEFLHKGKCPRFTQENFIRHDNAYCCFSHECIFCQISGKPHSNTFPCQIINKLSTFLENCMKGLYEFGASSDPCDFIEKILVPFVKHSDEYKEFFKLWYKNDTLPRFNQASAICPITSVSKDYTPTPPKPKFVKAAPLKVKAPAKPPRSAPPPVFEFNWFSINKPKIPGDGLAIIKDPAPVYKKRVQPQRKTKKRTSKKSNVSKK